MMTAPGAGAGKGITSDTDAGGKSARPTKPPLERTENFAEDAGTSRVLVRPNPLQETIEKLAMPVAPSVDAVLAQDQLEERRQHIHQEAIEVSGIRQELDISMREYNTAHGFTPVAKLPSRIGEVRNRGRNLNDEFARDGRSKSNLSASPMSADRPVYSTPAKNMRAAEAAAVELSSLTGEPLRKQQARVNELLYVANRQNEAYAKANPGIGGSHIVYSAGNVGGKSVGQASSPHVGRRRDGSVGSGKSKQLQAYDPAFAGK